MDRASKQVALKIALIAGTGVAVFATSDAVAAWARAEGQLTLREVRQCLASGAASLSHVGGRAEDVLIADFEKTFEKQFDDRLPA